MAAKTTRSSRTKSGCVVSGLIVLIFLPARWRGQDPLQVRAE